MVNLIPEFNSPPRFPNLYTSAFYTFEKKALSTHKRPWAKLQLILVLLTLKLRSLAMEVEQKENKIIGESTKSVNGVAKEIGNMNQIKKKRRSILKMPTNPLPEREALKVCIWLELTSEGI